MINYLKTFCLVLFLCVLSFFSKAQYFDSLTVTVGTVGTTATEAYQPLWLVSNKFATITDQKTDVSTHVRLANRHFFGLGGSDTTKPFSIAYGLDLYNNNHFQKLFFEEGFVKAGYKYWQLRAGRFEETTGEPDPELSSGSLGISGNALPIPKVGFVLTDYTDVPLTKGWVQFKGQFSHGWFGNDRYMKDAFLHEKILYLRFGKKKLKFYGGIQHFAEWGGRRGGLQLERSWKGFFDVVTVKEVDDGSVGSAVMPNRPGDQRGLLEAGFFWENDNLRLHGYNQTPFDSGLDIDFRNVDKLLGFSVAIKKKKTFIRKVLGEILYTKDMLSFVPPSGRQSYYNNGFYKTGWEYQGFIIGTPLFTNRTRASHYFSSIQPYNWDAADNTIEGNNNIINNRVVGAHVGLLYEITPSLKGKTLVTFTKNYGTHAPGVFSPHKDQWYTLQQFSYQIPKAFQFSVVMAFDRGDLSKNTGVSFSIEKEFHFRKN